MNRNIAAIAAVVGTLSGCNGLTNTATDERLAELRTSGLDPRQDDRIAQRFARITGRDAVASQLAAYDTSLGAEGTSVSLGRALELALEGNIEIGDAAEGINAASAARLNAILGYLPQVRATVNSSDIQQEVVRSDNAVFAAGTASYGSLDYAIELEQPLIDLGRIYEIRIAGVARSGAEVDYIAAVQRALFETFDAYLAAAQAGARREVLTRRARLIAGQVTAEQTRVAEGISEPSAVRALQVSLRNLELDASSAGIDEAEALGRLSAVTGQPISRVEPPRAPAAIRTASQQVSVAQAIGAAGENNPLILRSVISVAEADLRRMQSILADFTPVVTAFSRMVYEDREGSRFGGGSETEDMVFGVRVVVPIFNASGEGYETITSRVDFRRAVQGYLREKRRVGGQIRATHGRMVATGQALDRARAAERAARALVSTERTRVEAGTSEQFLVTELQSRALAASGTVQDLEYDYFRAWGELQFLMGDSLAEGT